MVACARAGALPRQMADIDRFRQDDRRALEWYRRAADHGSAPAQRALGDFYRKGRVVAADAAEAARWYRRGADGDDLQAQFQLGQLYFDGSGVARDYAAAYLWFSVAAGQTPLEDNRKGLIELRNIAAARMTPASTPMCRSPWSRSVWSRSLPTPPDRREHMRFTPQPSWPHGPIRCRSSRKCSPDAGFARPFGS